LAYNELSNRLRKYYTNPLFYGYLKVEIFDLDDVVDLTKIIWVYNFSLVWEDTALFWQHSEKRTQQGTIGDVIGPWVAGRQALIELYFRLNEERLKGAFNPKSLKRFYQALTHHFADFYFRVLIQLEAFMTDSEQMKALMPEMHKYGAIALEFCDRAPDHSNVQTLLADLSAWGEQMGDLFKLEDEFIKCANRCDPAGKSLDRSEAKPHVRMRC